MKNNENENFVFTLFTPCWETGFHFYSFLRFYFFSDFIFFHFYKNEIFLFVFIKSWIFWRPLVLLLQSLLLVSILKGDFWPKTKVIVGNQPRISKVKFRPESYEYHDFLLQREPYFSLNIEHTECYQLSLSYTKNEI